MISAVGRKYVRESLVRLPPCQTAAMSAGFDHAKGEIVITMDSDLQNDPLDIPKM